MEGRRGFLRVSWCCWWVVALTWCCAESSGEACNPSIYFTCANGRCVSLSFVCDGQDDCSDGSDEKACHLLTTSAPKCNAEEFQCLDKLCIPSAWACNGEFDCLDHSDELIGCANHTCEGGFTCKNGLCIAKDWVCDGSPDCTDNSDEEGCEIATLNVSSCLIANGKFLCKDGSACLSLHENVCNGHADCKDGSDEGGNCFNKDLCAEKKCAEVCAQTPEKAYCVCAKGYRIRDGVCEDVNECDEFGICDQNCINKLGSYECSCLEGFTLQSDRRTCRADAGEAMLLFGTSKDIRAYLLTSNVYYPVVSNHTDVVDVSYDGSYVYWSTIRSGLPGIYRKKESTDSNEKNEVIINSGLGRPEQIAVDWVTYNIYFTDGLFQHIVVCSSDGKMCSVLHKDLQNPRALVLDAEEGLIFWTEWGEIPTIGRSGMDGSHNTDLVTANLTWPNGLAIDHGTRRLYWIDAKLDIIESIKLDGTDRRIILKDTMDQPFALTIFEDSLYWSDWKAQTIKRCDKFTGKNLKTVVKEKKERVYGIHIYHPSLDHLVKGNPCENAKCSHMCTLAPKASDQDPGFSCICPQTTEKIDNKCAEKKVDYLIVAANGNFFKAHIRFIGNTEIERFSVPTIVKVSAMTFDPMEDRLIVADHYEKKIISIQMDSRKTTILVDSNIGRITGMDFDFYSNTIYWVDEDKRTVEVLSLNTMARKVLTSSLGSSDTPSDIALVPKEGVMFIAMHDGKSSHIDRLSMDGSLTSRLHVIETLVGPRVKLFYDRSMDRVFWVDPGSKSIASVESDGNHMLQYTTKTVPTDMTTIASEVVWAVRNNIYFINKFTFHSEPEYVHLEEAESSDDIKIQAIIHINTSQIHVCQENNGGCSHICLNGHGTKTCACPEKMHLSKDGLTCQASLNCGSYKFRCTDGQCIEQSSVCDGKYDCPDQEDETDCPAPPNEECHASEFFCHSGSGCAAASSVCDGHYDCPDRSDEMECKCDSPDRFKCGSGECILKEDVCNSYSNCFDNSDEENCKNVSCNTEFYFPCKSGSCIPVHWKCDGQIDCSDGSDESDDICVKEHECSDDLFKCKNKRCIDKSFLCNHADDCGDKSDEEDCSYTYAEADIVYIFNDSSADVTEECPRQYFSCPSSPKVCLRILAKCNGTRECPNGEDEEGCSGCGDDEFQCKSGKCILQRQKCDSVDNCGDNSDENDELCNYSVLHLQPRIENTSCFGVVCKDSKICVPFSQACDGHGDCEDGSDEGGLCERGCSVAGCSHSCHPSPNGGRCYCSDGYKLKDDSRTCEDINECLTPSACSQFCTNNRGSFKCSCLSPHFRLRSDRSRCKATEGAMNIIIATDDDIRTLSKTLRSEKLLYSSPDDKLTVSGLEANMKTKEYYWTSEIHGTLTKMSMDDSKKFTVVKNLTTPSKVSLDWVHENMYVVEKSSAVSACDLSFSKCVLVLVSEDQNVIGALALDPGSGLMFWSETVYHTHSKPESKIKVADLSGSNSKSLISYNLLKVTDISLDSFKRLVYWADGIQNTIERSTYEGVNREVIYKSEYHPIDLGYFEDYIYWASVQSFQRKGDNMIESCGLYGNANLDCSTKKLLPSGSTKAVQRFRVLHPGVQIQAQNNCSRARCDYLCVGSPKGPVCMSQNEDRYKLGLKRTLIGHSQESDKSDQSGSNMLLWTFLCFAGLIGIGAAAYQLVVHFPAILPRKHNFFGRVHFQNPTYGNEPSHTSTPFHHSQLAPGKHEYENINADIMMEFKQENLHNEINIQINTKHDFEDHEPDCMDKEDKTPLIAQ